MSRKQKQKPPNALSFLFVASLLFCVAFARAQQLQIRTYGTLDGIPQSEIDVIYQDRAGQIWFGTLENGLACYDGETMKVYKTEQGLPNLSVRSILEDEQGNVWVGTEGGLTCLRQDGSTRTFTVAEGLPSNRINDLVQDASGALWIATQAGLCRWDGDEKIGPEQSPSPAALFTAFRFNGSLAHNLVEALALDHENRLWLGTNDGLLLFKKERFLALPESERLSGHIVRDLLWTRERVLWAGTTAGLFRLHEGTREAFTKARGLREESVYCLGEDQKNNLWIGTRTCLMKYDGKSFTAFDTRHGLPNPYIRSLLVDYEDNLWLGTWGGGVGKIYGWQINNYKRNTGLPVDPVFCFLQDQQNRVWIGTNGGGAVILEDENVQTLNTSNVLPDNVVRGMDLSRSGEIWLATHGGAARLHNGKWQTFTRRQGLPDEVLRSVYCAPEGEVWFASFTQGAIRYRNGLFSTLSKKDGLPSNGVHQIYRDRQGRLWIATAGGLYVQENARGKTFTTQDGLPDSTVGSIFEDHAGAMWFGTRSGGAACYRDGRFEVFNTQNGLPNNGVYFVVEDEQQRIWFGTNTGVAYYDRQKFFYLHATDGLADDECNTRAVLKDHHGRLWIGTVGGASCIETALLPATAPPPRVQITSLVAGEQTYRALTKAPLRLPYKATLSFDFATLSFINEDEVSNRVFLEGFDEEWIDLKKQRSLRYTNLGPKRYTFHVRGTNALGVASAQTASVKFEVLPPFYLTPWFLILSAAAIVGLVWGGHRWRVQQVKTRAEELERAVTAKTDELQNTLTFLETIKDFLPLGLLVVDAKENIVDANRVALELFEYDLAALRGQQLFNVLSSPLSSREAMWRALTQKKAGIELVGLTRTGKHLICEIHSDSVTDAEGKPSLLILTCENIEAQKQLELKIIDGEKQLALVNLVVGMGEALNQKLAGIHGHLQTLHTQLAQSPSEDSARTLQNAQSSLQDMDKVLRQLLEFTAYLTKTPSLAVDLRQELLTLAERWQKKLSVALPLLSEPIPLRIFPKLRDGLDEALQNSLEAGADTVKVEVELLPNHSRVRVLFSDNGEGISTDTRNKAFLPFFKTRGTPHTGLGLWKLYQVVKQCGGSVEIDNLPAGGTQLRITLPLDSPKFYANASAQAEKRGASKIHLL